MSKTSMDSPQVSSASSSHSQSEELCETFSSSTASSQDDLNERTRSSFNLRKRRDSTPDFTEALEHSGSEYSSANEDSPNDDDEHEDECAICQKDTRPEKLLCCDRCPRVYHLGCLIPPLSRVPKGQWCCPKCLEITRIKDVEQILDETDSMYYVKWKDEAYIHCSWIDKSDFLEAKKRFAYLQAKLRAFRNKDQQSMDLEDYDPREFTNGVHSNWITVDKIVDAADTSHNMLLVKWKDLHYDQCTWEHVRDIKDAAQRIKEFKNQKSIRHIARVKAQAKRDKDNAASILASKEAGDGRYAKTPEFLRQGCELHPYQLEGLNWLIFKWDQEESVILADEMGLGKTIQAIAFLAGLWDEGVSLPHLVVAPLSTIQNWQREFEAWAPQLVVVTVTGAKAAREIILKHEIYVSKHLRKKRHKSNNNDKHVKCHVILTSYEVLSLESSKLGKIAYECLIVDEGHRLKGKGSKLVKDLNAFDVRHRIILTGTPLQNNIQELFALLHFIDGTKFDSWESFENDFAQISEEEQVKQLHQLLSPHLLRRLKKDVLKNLPPKKEQIVRVEMTEAQREMYKAILAQNFHLLVTEKRNKHARHGLVSVMMELRKCCAHPYLFEGVENLNLDKTSELEKMINISGKLQMLDVLLNRLKAKGHRVLIYSQFCIMLNILEDYLELKKYGFLRIDGSIRGMERQTLIDAFNRDKEKYFVFLLSTRAGGLGINLASADTVILYDSDFNPHNDIQAQARAHRLGQERPVMIYRLVTRLTIEERMIQLAKKKLVLEQIVVRKMGNEVLKQDELDGILRYGAEELFADERLADKQAHGSTIREQETERLAAETSTSRIVYDDEMIEKLLDRSDMATAVEDDMDVQNNELLEGFKIANFEVTNTVQDSQNMWRELLKHREEVKTVLDKEHRDPRIISPGRRRRRNEVVYSLDDAGSDDSLDSEYNVEGQETDDSESIELEADSVINEEAMTPTKKDDTVQEPESISKSSSVESVSMISWSGPELLIYGFSVRERQLFLNLLLRYGFPETPLGPLQRLDWSEFANRLPRKKHRYIDDYARILMAGAKGNLPQSITQQDMLFDCKPEYLLSKIGMMHVLQMKTRLVQNPMNRLWPIDADTSILYGHTRYWKEPQDRAFIRAVVRFGHGRWKDFLTNGENSIEAVLHRELAMTMESTKEATIDLVSTEMINLNGQTPNRDQTKDVVEKSEAIKRSRIRSTETKCRTWLANRLKLLVNFISAENDPSTKKRPTQPIQTSQPMTPNLVISGSLKWKYQAIVRQCFAVRESSNLVCGHQSYEQLQAAGAQFRKQMKELGDMAKSLRQSLPNSQESFRKGESEVKGRGLLPPLTKSSVSTVRLDAKLGTSGPSHHGTTSSKAAGD